MILSFKEAEESNSFQTFMYSFKVTRVTVALWIVPVGTAKVSTHSIPMTYHSFISLHSACVFLYFQGPAGKAGPPGSPGAAGEKV